MDKATVVETDKNYEVTIGGETILLKKNNPNLSVSINEFGELEFSVKEPFKRVKHSMNVEWTGGTDSKELPDFVKSIWTSLSKLDIKKLIDQMGLPVSYVGGATIDPLDAVLYLEQMKVEKKINSLFFDYIYGNKVEGDPDSFVDKKVAMDLNTINKVLKDFDKFNIDPKDINEFVVLRSNAPSRASVNSNMNELFNSIVFSVASYDNFVNIAANNNEIMFSQYSVQEHSADIVNTVNYILEQKITKEALSSQIRASIKYIIEYFDNNPEKLKLVDVFRLEGLYYKIKKEQGPIINW